MFDLEDPPQTPEDSDLIEGRTIGLLPSGKPETAGRSEARGEGSGDKGGELGRRGRGMN